MKKTLVLITAVALGLSIGCATNSEWVKRYHQYSIDPQTQIAGDDSDDLVIVNVDWRSYHKRVPKVMFGREENNYLLETDCPVARGTGTANFNDAQTFQSNRLSCLVFNSRSLMKREDAEKLGFTRCPLCFKNRSFSE